MSFPKSINQIGGGAPRTNNDASWLIKSTFTEKGSNTNAKFTLTARGLDYVFQSTDDVRFFYVKDYKTLDTKTGLSVQDRIDILPDVNTQIEKGAGATVKATIDLDVNVSGAVTIQLGETPSPSKHRYPVK